MFKYLIALLVCFSSLKAADCDSTFYLYIYFYEGDKDMLKLEMNACQTIDELKNLIYYYSGVWPEYLNYEGCWLKTGWQLSDYGISGGSIYVYL